MSDVKEPTKPGGPNCNHVLVYEPYPWGKVSGNLQTLTGMLKYTPESQVRFTLMVPFDGGYLERAEDLGISSVILPPPDRLNTYGGTALRKGFLGRALTALDLFRYNLAIRNHLIRNNVEVVYANCVRTALTVGLAARLAGVPMLLYIKGELDNSLLDRIALLLATRVLFFCEANRDDHYPHLIRMMKKKVGILPPGLDPELLAAVESADTSELVEQFDLDGGGENIGYLGQLYPPKGVHFLVEAFGLIAIQFPRARLFLIGDPVIDEYEDYPAQLRMQVDELGLQDRVVFTGWREDALNLLAQLDVVAHPTLAEGFGRGVLEAMALGKPVVASAVGGLRESVVDTETGYLVPPEDPLMLADRLGKLLGDRELRRVLGDAGRRRVRERFMVQDKIKKLSDLWTEMAEVGR